MVKCNSFDVYVDVDQPLVSVHLHFHTHSRKDLTDAIELLVSARDKLQDLDTRKDEQDD